MLKVAAAVSVVAIGLAFATPAQAQWGVVWPSGAVQVQRTYQPTYLHWTPGLGVHTHGHYDYRPVYSPGHFDAYHGGHMHWNHYFH